MIIIPDVWENLLSRKQLHVPVNMLYKACNIFLLILLSLRLQSAVFGICCVCPSRLYAYLTGACVGQLIAEGFLIVLCLDRVRAGRGHSVQ